MEQDLTVLDLVSTWKNGIFSTEVYKRSFKQKPGWGQDPLLQRGSLLLPVAPLGLRPQLPAGCSRPSLRDARGD